MINSMDDGGVDEGGKGGRRGGGGVIRIPLEYERPTLISEKFSF